MGTQKKPMQTTPLMSQHIPHDSLLLQPEDADPPSVREPSKTTLREIAVDPSWRELFTRISRISGPPTIQSFNSSQCIVNGLLPLTLGAFVTTFDTPDIAPFPVFGASPWPYIITYVILRFLASSGGLAAIHDTLLIPLMQSYPCTLTQLAYETQDGQASVVLTRYRTRIQRQMNERGVVIRGIHADCLLNYKTVKYFGGEEYEAQRYTEAIGEYQSLERSFSLNLLNLVQKLIITSGLLFNSLIVVSRIAGGQSGTSGSVVFIAYYVQLYFPFSNLFGVYHAINRGLVDTEKLLYLLNEPTEMVDELDTKELVVTNSEVEFVPRGGRVALVGEGGGGKSTILRLLYRFSDLQPGSGHILIDGQDIRTVILSSLCCAIGVVPQDSVLFNAIIGYNIAYGQPSTTPADENTIISSVQAATVKNPRFFGIMILKDERTVEQGSHRELLELDGLFASMWADQVSASEDPKAPAGYDVDDDAPVVNIPESDTCSTAVEEHIAVDPPNLIPASLPPKADVSISFSILDDLPQTVPTTASSSNFPSIHSHPEHSAIPTHMQGLRVTFDVKVTMPPRAGLPEPRRALSTHDVQRLARRSVLAVKL
ncbi:hypothetical protein EDB19DRAFT_2028878 [Suillus lakei]|nr:hypothetical protein EDB19DRAFT_2028878 [Suillus lakei]